MKYWIQTQAPAGNWCDTLGTDDLMSARNFADYQRSLGRTVRVAERADVVVPDRGEKVEFVVEEEPTEADELLLNLNNQGVLDGHSGSKVSAQAQARVDAKRYLRQRGLIS